MEFVRKHVGAIAGTAVAGMILWLVATAVTVQSMQADYAGTLFGKKVPLEDYSRAFDSVTRQALMQYGDQYREQVPPDEMENRAWERLTFLQEAKRKGVQVSDNEVVEEIAAYPFFQDKEGRFDQAGYQNVLQYSMGTTPRAFEEETRQNLMIGKLVRGITSEIPVTEQEIEEAFQRRESLIRVTALSVSNRDAAREITESVRQEPSRISQAAKELGKEAVFAGPFKRSDVVPGLGISGSNFDPVFPLNPGEVSPEPVSSGDEWFVVRLDEKQPADPAQLTDETRGTLRSEITENKKMRAYLEWYVDVLKRADRQVNPRLQG